MRRLVTLLTIAFGGLCGLITGASAQEVIRIGAPRSQPAVVLGGPSITPTGLGSNWANRTHRRADSPTSFLSEEVRYGDRIADS